MEGNCSCVCVDDATAVVRDGAVGQGGRTTSVVDTAAAAACVRIARDGAVG